MQVFDSSELRCVECGKVFTRRGDLVTHIKVHTGERPYPCRAGCEMYFKTSSNRARHERLCVRSRE